MVPLLEAGSVILSHFTAERLLAAQRRKLSEIDVSLDLNLSVSRVSLDANGVEFDGGRRASWEVVRKIAGSPNGCFLTEAAGVWRIQVFSSLTHRPCSLMPTTGAPTALVAGFTMHRIKGITPDVDAQRKLEALGRPRGRVLDTSTGLGYTAIEAARTASEVVTIELDPAMLELAGYNPWSRELFRNPRITQRTGDSARLVTELESSSFDAVLHDPPTFRLAGELYSQAFYRELQRLLVPEGRLFHYVGDPKSRHGGRLTRQVVRSLNQAGFGRIVPRPATHGVTAANSHHP